ncbi:MAG: pilus assembly protein [Actinomycetota bacterium]|nr:pilus assembly protein [Actinomycetota bacterium]
MKLPPRAESGSAAVESIFAIVFLVSLVLGAIQVAFTLYGRNVIISSAHEGARAAIELGRSPEEAAVLARRTVERSAGSLVTGLHVDVASTQSAFERTVTVSVRAHIKAFGPIPVSIPVVAVGRTSAASLP